MHQGVQMSAYVGGWSQVIMGRSGYCRRTRSRSKEMNTTRKTFLRIAGATGTEAILYIRLHRQLLAELY